MISALDNIIEDILKQANEKARGILDEANQKAAEILKTGEADRAEWERRHNETLDHECREIEKRAQSTDRQNRKLALLTTRNQVIDEVIAEAKTRLTLEADRDRFSMVWQGDILLNNTIDAIFEVKNQTLRDVAYEALTEDA